MGEALPALAEFFGGMLAIAIVFALLFIASLVLSIANYLHVGALPFLGGALMDAIRGVVHALTWLKDWIWAHCNPATLFMGILGQTANTISGGSWDLMWAEYHAMQRIHTVTIPGAIAIANARAVSLYNSAIARVAIAAAAAQLYAFNLYMDTLHAISAAETNAKTYTDASAKTLQNELNGIKALIGTSALGLVQTLQGWALQQLAELRTFVNQTDAARGATTQGQIGDAVRGVENTLAPEIAGAAAIGAAAAAAFNAWRNSCGDPLCNNLSNFGNVISALEGLLGPVAILAILAEIAHDPAGAVDDVVAVGNDVVTPVWDTISAATGLRAA